MGRRKPVEGNDHNTTSHLESISTASSPRTWSGAFPPSTGAAEELTGSARREAIGVPARKCSIQLCGATARFQMTLKTAGPTSEIGNSSKRRETASLSAFHGVLKNADGRVIGGADLPGSLEVEALRQELAGRVRCGRPREPESLMQRLFEVLPPSRPARARSWCSAKRERARNDRPTIQT